MLQNAVSPTDVFDKLPAIKFLKQTVPDILSGAKTLEVRPRSQGWIERLRTAERARLTYGPRMGTPTTFAIGRILDIDVRGFATATRTDVDRIGAEWVGRDVATFVSEYTEWYAAELAKDYPVVWISFAVERELEP